MVWLSSMCVVAIHHSQKLNSCLVHLPICLYHNIQFTYSSKIELYMENINLAKLTILIYIIIIYIFN